MLTFPNLTLPRALPSLIADFILPFYAVPDSSKRLRLAGGIRSVLRFQAVLKNCNPKCLQFLHHTSAHIFFFSEMVTPMQGVIPRPDLIACLLRRTEHYRPAVCTSVSLFRLLLPNLKASISSAIVYRITSDDDRQINCCGKRRAMDPHARWEGQLGKNIDVRKLVFIFFS